MNVSPVHQDVSRGLDEFVRYRREHLQGRERGEAQVFLDRLFRALGHQGVAEVGATLEMRVARRSGRGAAFADLVWKPRVLIEMKRAGEPLQRHYRQAFEYWIDLVPDRPKYVILCNFDELWVYDLNAQLDEPVDRVALTDLPRRWESLAFLLPIPDRPQFRNDLVAVTRESAAMLAGVFNRLVDRGVPRPAAQRAVLQSVMAMFSEDVQLLPRHVFRQALEDCLHGASAYDLLFGLFREMNAPGVTPAGRYAGTPYFNGGLFREIMPIDLEPPELEALYQASSQDWRAVRPAIFGTLFEQSLGRAERHAYGAHFTSETDIQKVVLPTIVRPWRDRIDGAGTIAELGQVEAELLRFHVLDPACGCGNFLYVAYRELRRLEKSLQERMLARRRRANAEIQPQFAFVSPRQFYGIDVNPFAVEVAKVTLMLGTKLAADELQDQHSVLPLDDLEANFQAGDALALTWPEFEACIGNPPYLGRRRLIEERGAPYAAWLARQFPAVGGVSDYVVYWYRKTHDLLPHGCRAGLVGTNTIRQGASRQASLDYIVDRGGTIYDAVSTQPWSGDAAVYVSIVNWIKGSYDGPRVLWLQNGATRLYMDEIVGSLSPAIDLRAARTLRVNSVPKVCFEGQTPGETEGLVISPDDARDLIRRDGDVGVIHPYLVGDDLLRRGTPPRYVIDFALDDPLAAQAQAPTAFERVRRLVLPRREERARREALRNAEVLRDNPDGRVNWHHRRFLELWWKHSYRREDMLAAIATLPRYIAVSRVASENRRTVCAFVSAKIRPGDALQVFAFADEYSFGILQSSVHHRWFIERCSTFEARPRYTATTVFDSFPWPQAPSAAEIEAIVQASVEILEYRLQLAAAGLSLADQYDSLRLPGRSILRDLHSRLDRAVFAAYGFSEADDVLAQVLALNESVADEEAHGITRPRGPGNSGGVNAPRTDYMVLPPLGL